MANRGQELHSEAYAQYAAPGHQMAHSLSKVRETVKREENDEKFFFQWVLPTYPCESASCSVAYATSASYSWSTFSPRTSGSSGEVSRLVLSRSTSCSDSSPETSAKGVDSSGG